jgi:hypothetical protein
VLQIIVLCTALVVGLWVSLEVLERPHLVAPLVVATSVLASLDVDLRIPAGSVTVYPADLLLVVIALSTGIGLLLGRLRPHRSTWPWLALLVLLAVAVGRGIGEFGLERASNAARLLGLFLVTTTFIALQRHHLRRIADWTGHSLVAGAAVLSVSASLFLIRNGLGTFGTDGRRALDSLGALLIAQAVLVTLARRDLSAGIRWTTASIGIVVLVATQQRTVAVAVVAGVLVLVATAGRGTRAQTLAGLGLGAVVVVVAVGSLTGLSQSVRVAANEPFQRNSTFNWRVQGWAELIRVQLDDSDIDLAIGDPAGEGTARRIRIDGQVREVQVSAHSQWISTLVALGVVGLAAWSAAVAWIVWRSARLRLPELAGWYAAGAAALVFSVTYQLSADQGLIIGLLAAAAALGTRWAGPDPTTPSDPAVVLADAA